MVEDFTAALDGVGDDSDGDEGAADRDSASHGADVGGLATNVFRELDEMRRVMAVPPPDATAADLRRVCAPSIKISKLNNADCLLLGTRKRSTRLYARTTGPRWSEDRVQ